MAAREDWSAWVTEDSGCPLRESFTSSNCESAIRQLAQLQIQSIGHVNTLQQNGCPYLSIGILQDHLEELFVYLESAMAQQTSTKVAPLTPVRLRQLRNTLYDVCAEMQGLGIPDTLVHCDLNLGNVLVKNSACVFIDWAEAAVGNPILNYEYFRQHILRHSTETEGWDLILSDVYKAQWKGLLTTKQMGVAFTLAPILAIASHLYGKGSWLNFQEPPAASVQAYHRSLARHIDRAAKSLEQTRALW